MSQIFQRRSKVVKVLDKVSFIMGRDDKIAFIGDNEIAITTMYRILAGELEPDEGTVKWGVSTTQAYFPKDNSAYFDACELPLMDWMRQFSGGQARELSAHVSRKNAFFLATMCISPSMCSPAVSVSGACCLS